MVQQKKLSFAAMKANAEASLATDEDEIMKIQVKSMDEALSPSHQAETKLTQMLIGKTDQQYLEEVQMLQQLAIKFTELKRPCLVCASQDDCGYIGTQLKCFQLDGHHSNRFESWIHDH